MTNRLSKTSEKAESPCIRLSLRIFGATLWIMNSDVNNKILESADLTIFPDLGQVKVGEQVVRLGPVNMGVLLTLLQKQGEVVSRAVLFDTVWKNQVVSDDTLTRCISDLRSQLGGISSQSSLIETVPKRGYRWLAKVQLQQAAGGTIKPHAANGWLTWVLGSVTAAAILVLTLWGFTQFLVRPDLVRVALLPIHAQPKELQSTAEKFASLLRSNLLKTDSIRFLSTSAIASRPNNPFPYFAREFGTHWIIEGQVHQIDQKLNVSLSLVDARTAIVVYTLNKQSERDASAIEAISEQFIEQIQQEIAR